MNRPHRLTRRGLRVARAADRPAPPPQPKPAPTARRGVDARLLAVPLVVANALAMLGQFLYAYDALRLFMPGLAATLVAAAAACAVESIALVLSAIAHEARMDGDASLPTRLAAYAIAAAAGAMNWAHWSARVEWLGWLFAAFSVASPWLWGIWSKAKHRAELRATGQVDKRAVRFSAARWVLHPSRTARVLWHASWDGVDDPAEAIRRWEQARATRDEQPPVVEAPVVVESTVVDPRPTQVPAIAAPPRPEQPTPPARRPTSTTSSTGKTGKTGKPSGDLPDAVRALIAARVADGWGRPRIAGLLREQGHTIADRTLTALIAAARATQPATREDPAS